MFCPIKPCKVAPSKCLQYSFRLVVMAPEYTVLVACPHQHFQHHRQNHHYSQSPLFVILSTIVVFVTVCLTRQYFRHHQHHHRPLTSELFFSSSTDWSSSSTLLLKGFNALALFFLDGGLRRSRLLVFWILREFTWVLAPPIVLPLRVITTIDI